MEPRSESSRRPSAPLWVAAAVACAAVADRLRAVVDELMCRGIATESRGARAILSDGSVPPKDDPFLIHKEGEWIPNPFIIQKSDGAFLYATTDLATLKYRQERWHPAEIVIVTDAPDYVDPGWRASLVARAVSVEPVPADWLVITGPSTTTRSSTTSPAVSCEREPG